MRKICTEIAVFVAVHKSYPQSYPQAKVSYPQASNERLKQVETAIYERGMMISVQNLRFRYNLYYFLGQLKLLKNNLLYLFCTNVPKLGKKDDLAWEKSKKPCFGKVIQTKVRPDRYIGTKYQEHAT